jgi:hypothetical protein
VEKTARWGGLELNRPAQLRGRIYMILTGTIAGQGNGEEIESWSFYAVRFRPSAGLIASGCSPRGDGFDGLERTLDLFRSEGVALVIPARGSAASGNRAKQRRRHIQTECWGASQQAMLVCTDDLWRASAFAAAACGTRALGWSRNLVHRSGFRYPALQRQHFREMFVPTICCLRSASMRDAGGLGPALACGASLAGQWA